MKGKQKDGRRGRREEEERESKEEERREKEEEGRRKGGGRGFYCTVKLYIRFLPPSLRTSGHKCPVGR